MIESEAPSNADPESLPNALPPPMIPLSLTVRNFLCYRGELPPLDLRGVHIACLCGDNGHGKSALLDAITWCLWGQARTGGRNHDALITHGEDECRVELDFDARGQTYRVMRRRRRSGRGQTQADLFVLDDGENTRPLTGNTLRDTDARIRQVVGMDYETFVNSAFLLQGRSDEFMRKTPGERKDTLSAILGINLFDALQASSRELRDRHRTELGNLQASLDRSRTALAAIPDPTEELDHVAGRVNQLSGDLAAKAVESEQMRSQVATLQEKRSSLQGVGGRSQALKTEVAGAERDASTVQKRIAATRELVNRAGEMEAGVAALASARSRLQQLETLRSQYEALGTERNDLQRIVDRTGAEMSAAADALSRRISDDLEPVAARADGVAQRMASLSDAETAIIEDSEAIDIQIAETDEMRQLLAARDVEIAQCIEEGKTLRARLEDMQSADAVCPLCGTPLSDDACGNIAAYYQGELDGKRQLHRELTASKADLAARSEALAADTEGRRNTLQRTQRRVQRERGRLEEEQRQCESAQELLVGLRPRLVEAQHALTQGEYAVPERSRLAAIDARMTDLGYDDGARQQVFQLTQSLQLWEHEHANLEAARSTMPSDEANLQRIMSQIAGWSREISELERRLEEDRAAIEQLPALEDALDVLERTVAELRQQIDAASQRRGALLAAAETRRQHQADVHRLTRESDAAQSELSIYSELFAAFGRSGVPAMLIDAAVPRVETEANLLLGRMTDNRMAVKLETQRVNQAGNVTETLDILISDELGTRSYDLFSGGEAFRINLALRIALSKVLAQRMGVPLPTLFIDEGFGTQDAAGRERIIDTITSIQDQFEKIIVITHLEELKNLFDVHIQVEKSDTGSRFELVAN